MVKFSDQYLSEGIGDLVTGTGIEMIGSLSRMFAKIAPIGVGAFGFREEVNEDAFRQIIKELTDSKEKFKKKDKKSLLDALKFRVKDIYTAKILTGAKKLGINKKDIKSAVLFRYSNGDSVVAIHVIEEDNYDDTSYNNAGNRFFILANGNYNKNFAKVSGIPLDVYISSNSKYRINRTKKSMLGGKNGIDRIIPKGYVKDEFGRIVPDEDGEYNTDGKKLLSKKALYFADIDKQTAMELGDWWTNSGKYSDQHNFLRGELPKVVNIGTEQQNLTVDGKVYPTEMDVYSLGSAGRVYIFKPPMNIPSEYDDEEDKNGLNYSLVFLGQDAVGYAKRNGLLDFDTNPNIKRKYGNVHVQGLANTMGIR